MCITISPLSSPTASACLWQEAEDSKTTVHSHSQSLMAYSITVRNLDSGKAYVLLLNIVVVDWYTVTSCAGHVSLMRRSCQSHAQVMSVSCPGHVSLMRRLCQSHPQVMSVSCPDPQTTPGGKVPPIWQLVKKNASFHECTQTLKTLSVTKTFCRGVSSTYRYCVHFLAWCILETHALERTSCLVR